METSRGISDAQQEYYVDMGGKEINMEGNVTIRSTLLDCLQIKRRELGVCSKHYNGLEPAKGMEEAWDIHRREVDLLEKLIQSMDSEEVRVALAAWQVEVMQNNGRADSLKLDGGPGAGAVFYE